MTQLTPHIWKHFVYTRKSLISELCTVQGNIWVTPFRAKQVMMPALRLGKRLRLSVSHWSWLGVGTWVITLLSHTQDGEHWHAVHVDYYIYLCPTIYPIKNNPKQVSRPPMSSSDWDLDIRHEIPLTFTWTSPDHVTIIWPSSDPYKTLT